MFVYTFGAPDVRCIPGRGRIDGAADAGRKKETDRIAFLVAFLVQCRRSDASDA